MPKHPATFSVELLPRLAELCKPFSNILDPMAGTGKIALIRYYGYVGRITCNDLEPEWADPIYLVDEWHYTDAASMDWAKDEQFECIVTSPTYGNRMADHFIPRDTSRRISYSINLGHRLSPGNTGTMQYGIEYCNKNESIVKECWRVLQPVGLFIVNMSNHWRNNQEINVITWWIGCASFNGFKFIHEDKISTKRMRYGANSNARALTESILVFQKEMK